MAALWVLTLHFGEELAVLFPWWSRLRGLTGHGELGVDVFFVLSGFIISYVYLARFPSGFQRQGFGKFVWYRFARVYPNHLVTLLAVVGMVVIGRLAGFAIAGDYGGEEAVYHGLLLHAWPWVERGHWNYPSWSISAEWFAYVLVFPLVLVAARSAIFLRGALVWCYVALGLFLVPYGAGWLGDWDLLVRVSTEFFAGGMLYIACRDSAAVRRFCERWCSVVAFAAIAAMLVLGKTVDKPVMVAGVVVCVPVILGGLAGGSGVLAKLLSTRVMVWGGHISYALYLVHALVEKVFKVAFAGVGADSPLVVRAGVALLYFAVPIGLAAGLYYLVEEPARKWLRDVWKRREARGT